MRSFLEDTGCVGEDYMVRVLLLSVQFVMDSDHAIVWVDGEQAHQILIYPRTRQGVEHR